VAWWGGGEGRCGRVARGGGVAGAGRVAEGGVAAGINKNVCSGAAQTGRPLRAPPAGPRYEPS